MAKSFQDRAALVVCGLVALAAWPLRSQEVKPTKQDEAVTAAKLLAEADGQFGSRDLVRAGASYRRVLDLPAANPVHAKAYYGLARIAALSDDDDQAEELFRKTLKTSPDDVTKSWVYLYLGRIAFGAGERDEAQKNFRAVLAITAAPELVKTAAQKELARANRPARPTQPPAKN